MKNCWMLQSVTVAGGKTDSIRERHGPLILATMSRSVVAVTAGGRVD